jgi:hypothetical protein
MTMESLKLLIAAPAVITCWSNGRERMDYSGDVVTIHDVKPA